MMLSTDIWVAALIRRVELAGSFAVVVRKGDARAGSVLVKVLNCAMTMVAVALVDRKGRKFLLRIGTGGIVVALVAGGLIFHSFESRRIDLKSTVQSAVLGNSLSLPFSAMEPPGSAHAGAPAIITVLYSYDSGDKMVTARSDQESALTIQPEGSEAKSPLVIKRAVYGSVPPQTTMFSWDAGTVTASPWSSVPRVSCQRRGCR